MGAARECDGDVTVNDQLDRIALLRVSVWTVPGSVDTGLKVAR